MKICIVATDYPSSKHTHIEFVKQLVEAWADMGNECVVVAPFCQKDFPDANPDYFDSQKTRKGNIVRILRPRYQKNTSHTIGIFNLYYFFHGIAVNRGLKSMHFSPDIIYCHFWSNALEAYPYAKKHKIPLFVASGEAIVPSKYSKLIFKGFRQYIKGVICVSTKTQKECLDIGLVSLDNSIAIPNAINPQLFHIKNKEECRRGLDIPVNMFVVAFVGSFCSRKGCMRVASAIDKLCDNSVAAIFIGKGDNDPVCNNLLFKGQVAHEHIIDYLNASDVFVLPSRNEGCCNAVIEAMACGLPIISSNLPFNWDVLDESNSILVDPDDINDISNAIARLSDDKQLRYILSQGAQKKADTLTISNRAERVMNFIKEQLNKY